MTRIKVFSLTVFLVTTLGAVDFPKSVLGIDFGATITETVNAVQMKNLLILDGYAYSSRILRKPEDVLYNSFYSFGVMGKMHVRFYFEFLPNENDEIVLRRIYVYSDPHDPEIVDFVYFKANLEEKYGVGIASSSTDGNSTTDTIIWKHDGVLITFKHKYIDEGWIPTQIIYQDKTDEELEVMQIRLYKLIDERLERELGEKSSDF